MTIPKPTPTLDGLSGEWYGYLAQGELRFQRCTACRTWRHPPRITCRACGTDGWTWERSTGEGEIYSWTVTHQALHPAFADEAPYGIVIAALEEPGVRLVAGWDGPLDALALGLPVVVTLADGGEGPVLPRLAPQP